jgi:triosephosphate isomerase
MLVDAGIPWVVLGHSERRTLCGETNEVVATKVKYALGLGLKVMACIGETLEQREAGTTLQVCEAQLAAIASASPHICKHRSEEQLAARALEPTLHGCVLLLGGWGGCGGLKEPMLILFA